MGVCQVVLMFFEGRLGQGRAARERLVDGQSRQADRTDGNWNLSYQSFWGGGPLLSTV